MSAKTRNIAHVVRKYLGMTPKQYRKTLSTLRARINVLERLMSEGRWDEIEFDKIPSKAGLKYKNAFARHDIERIKKNPEVKTYADFAKDTTTKVNAKDLYPYEVVDKAVKQVSDETDRLMVNKFWDNLTDYFNGKSLNALAVVDTSGSMTWHGGADKPINVAISLGLYCAEKAKALEAMGFRVEVDYRNEKIGKKIREATLEKIPYMLVVGDRDMENGTVSPRYRSGEDLGAMSFEEFASLLKTVVDNREKK